MSDAPGRFSDEVWQALTGLARAYGREHGHGDGHEYPIETKERARRLLVVLVDGEDDERVTGDLPGGPLSGEQAGGMTPGALYARLGLGAQDDTDDAELCRVYEEGYDEAMTAAVVARSLVMLGFPAPVSTAQAQPSHHRSGYHRTRVTLLATSNPYLAPRLPLAGEVEVFETSTHGHPLPGKVVFRELLAGGRLGAPAHVDDIAYVYAAPDLPGTSGPAPEAEPDSERVRVWRDPDGEALRLQLADESIAELGAGYADLEEAAHAVVPAGWVELLDPDQSWRAIVRTAQEHSRTRD